MLNFFYRSKLEVKELEQEQEQQQEEQKEKVKADQQEVPEKEGEEEPEVPDDEKERRKEIFKVTSFPFYLFFFCSLLGPKLIQKKNSRCYGKRS